MPISEIHLPTPGLDGFGEAELLDLEERCADILRMRTGMLDGKPRSLRATGEEISVTRERVRQLQNQGLLVIREVREAQRHLRDERSIRRAFYPPREAMVRAATEGRQA
jgi:hypothetical protein